MSCPYHQNHCAFPDWDITRCEICHCTWEKITAPATRVTIREGLTRRKAGQRQKPTMVEDVAYLSGYGEMPLNHLWRHAVEIKRRQSAALRKARPLSSIANTAGANSLTSPGVRVGLVVLALLGLTACASSNKFSQYGNDAPRTSVVNADAADIISFPDGFSNMSTKCDHGNRVYSLFHGNSNYGALAVVPNDPSCAK